MKSILRKHMASFVVAALFAAIYAGAVVGLSLLLQQVIDMATAGNVRTAAYMAVVYFGAFLLIGVLRALSEVRLNQKVMGEIRSTIVKKILRKDTINFEKHKESDYVSLVQNDVKKIEDTYIEAILAIIACIVQLILAITVMTSYSWVFTVFMFAMTGLMFVVPTLFSKKLAAANEELSKAQEDMTESLTEVVAGYEVAKSFQKEDYCCQKYDKCNGHLIKKARSFGLLKEINNTSSNSLVFAMQMVICVLAGYFIYAGRISYGSMVGVIQVSGSFCQPLFQLFALIPAIKALTPIWDKIEEYTKEADMKEDPKELVAGEWKSITFKGTSFSYPNEDRKVLSDIDLFIEKGKKYLIVGDSGSGKTTLINMICGNYVPQEGKILIDGKETNTASDRLKKTTAVVWQNVFLFNESIKENIVMGAVEDRALSETVKEAQIEDMVNDKGFDYKVGSDGCLLSGGQKQRIAIARALFAGRDIIVLDEGVSALDKETASEIENMLLNQKGRTLIQVSHHVTPENRARYDKVIEIKDGRVRCA